MNIRTVNFSTLALVFSLTHSQFAYADNPPLAVQSISAAGEEAVRFAQYFAMHPEKISMDSFKRVISHFDLAECFDSESNRRCTYRRPKANATETLSLITLVTKKDGSSLGGILIWELSTEHFCINDRDVKRILKTAPDSPGLPTTTYAGPSSPAAPPPVSKRLIYPIDNADVTTESGDCVTRIEVNAVLSSTLAKDN
ncbi:hypothetical protein [Duganella violaceipulchra]|uniref:Uncharacterized protein n=1 Tax=Duganella violaceipulchra TaxID=2849652 RepID=A0AA41HEP6_9BURK|nr:hypothetical protein [Duganella violaceicalia]MBV6323642.1 hypothetical protein [Duganella violaceicalia]MCP2008996.1 hypothetical protein [Duganella violaceicalia]